MSRSFSDFNPSLSALDECILVQEDTLMIEEALQSLNDPDDAVIDTIIGDDIKNYEKDKEPSVKDLVDYILDDEN